MIFNKKYIIIYIEVKKEVDIIITLNELRTGVNTQYGFELTNWEIATNLGYDTWKEIIYLVYIGSELEIDENNSIENCLYTYLRDIFPNEEYIEIDFSR